MPHLREHDRDSFGDAFVVDGFSRAEAMHAPAEVDPDQGRVAPRDPEIDSAARNVASAEFVDELSRACA